VNAEDLFSRFFLPLYPEDARVDLARARATDANPASNPAVLKHLDGAADAFVHNAASLFGTDLHLDRSDASVHRLSAALTAERRDAWVTQGEPGTPESTLFNAVIHGTAYVGACVVASHGGVWSVRRPLWESVVRLRSPAGVAELAVFHWWLKSLAADAIPGSGGATPGNATLADRYRTHVEVPCAPTDAMPFIFAAERSLPRLKDPTYDKLHKYLRAHLPELRDLGDNFPSPERFAELGFRWMDFHRLGGGRLALFAGASPSGLHLFWLGAAGFDKSVFIPCDAFPDPIVRSDAERVTAITSEGGANRVHEMLWWGP
jgi:hypothetical protein